MKKKIACLTAIFLVFAISALQAQTTKSNKLFIDVHLLHPGTVTAADVAAAHAKDLAVQGKHGVQFLKYWVDEKAGTVYCLSSAPDSLHITAAHHEAHGLLPQQVYQVTGGIEAAPLKGVPYLLDIHNLGAGNVTAAAVADAHKKDLAVQKKHGVNFINYWVCEEKGIVFCLSQAKEKNNVEKTHKDAHGLMPAMVVPVVQGQ
jgi:phenolic acid decarboxylase